MGLRERIQAQPHSHHFLTELPARSPIEDMDLDFRIAHAVAGEEIGWIRREREERRRRRVWSAAESVWERGRASGRGLEGRKERVLWKVWPTRSSSSGEGRGNARSPWGEDLQGVTGKLKISLIQNPDFVVVSLILRSGSTMLE